MTVVPNAAFLDGATPTITLAGQEWPIPQLTPRQQKHVLPALFELIPVLVTIRSAGEEQAIGVLKSLDQASYDLMITAVYWGVKKAHPNMTRDEFEDMNITPPELISALKVVSDQTNIIKERDPAVFDGADESLGEATAVGTA